MTAGDTGEQVHPFDPAIAEFERISVALWWVPAGHTRSVPEGVERLEHLDRHGPTSFAFRFTRAFGPEGVPVPREEATSEDTCPAG